MKKSFWTNEAWIGLRDSGGRERASKRTHTRATTTVVTWMTKLDAIIIVGKTLKTTTLLLELDGDTKNLFGELCTSS